LRVNLPVTQQEHEIADGVTLLSTTDPRSQLTYANEAFVEVSGFDRAELLGQPHNVVRHPDMPREAFADMWATLQGGESWTALVKNRRKNGDHYWVRANATPVRRDGRVVGYMSVRTKPTRAEVAAAEALYRDFREGRARGRAFHKGLVVRTGWLKWTSAMRLMPVRWRIRTGLAAVAATAALAALAAGAAPWLPALFALLGTVGSWWIERQVAAPLALVLRQAMAVAAGQIDMAPPLNRVDEIGMLARAVTQAGLNLRSLLDDVGTQVGGIQGASSEFAAGNADLSGRTEQAAASLQQTAASMTQIGSTLASNAGRSREAEDLAHQAVKAAEAGSDDVSQMARTMAEIEANGKRMADITGLIDSIAFQTNILALNAAVEAARAGDAGRGFAVVASEVRLLAQRSADAARDIRGLIQGSVACIASGAGLAQQTSDAMAQIVEGVRRVSTLIEEIALATTQQSEGVNQVEGAVSQLDQVTQQNAALVEQGAASAEALKHQATRLAAAVAAFSVVPA